MKRSTSLLHIPTHAPVPKRPRLVTTTTTADAGTSTHQFPPSVQPSSLLVLPNDVLLRIFRLLLNSDKINISSCARLGPVIRLASTCRRLRHIFFTSIREIDGLIVHARHDLPLHDHATRCTTCPALLPLPLLLQLVKATALSLRILRLPALDSDSTALVLTGVASNSLQLRQLIVNDRGSAVERSGVLHALSATLREVEISEPTAPTLLALPDGLTSLRLLAVSPKCAGLIIAYLRKGGRRLNSLTVAFHNGRRFLPEPFAFSRFNLHRVYPDLHLELSKGVTDVLKFITQQGRLPLLQHLSIHTVGVDLNQESCDLINCPPPVKGLDALTGTVRLIRDAATAAARDPTRKKPLCPLRTLELRTDHPLFRASLTAIAPLLSPYLLFTLHVHDLSLLVPPSKPDPLTPSTLLLRTFSDSISKYSGRDTTSVQATQPPAQDENSLLRHGIISARLESLLHSNSPSLSRQSIFSQLKTLDVSCSQFCLDYGRNVLAHRPRLVSLLHRAEDSLHTIRVNNFLRGLLVPSAAVGQALLVDVLCHAPNVRTLELSDEFLITTLYDNNMTDLFLHFQNFHTIRFGGLSSTPAYVDNVGTNGGSASGFGSTNQDYNFSGPSTAAAMTKFFHVLPVFFNLIRKSCPLLKSLVLLSLFPADRAGHFRAGHSLRDATKALSALERDLPNVDTYTVRTQLRLWSSKSRTFRSK